MAPRVSRPKMQSDYNRFAPTVPIVIDNGSSSFRIGWAGESDPRVSFRSIVQRPRHKVTGDTVTIVGEFDPSLMKYFDCTRSPARSPFDSNVVYQFELMEYVLDFGFERLGCNGLEVGHPILMTECVCNPLASRSKMAELLFETYNIPSIAFGTDVAFSYKYNQQLGICNEDGIAICAGFTTSHVIPFVKGEPVFEACCRTNVGGYNITEYLKQLLSLKYPHHANSITWEKAEDLKKEHCYIALDYSAELKLFQRGTKEAEEKTRYWQLPWVPPPQEEPPSEEELARKAASKEKQIQRLRDMAASKRSSKIADLEAELNALEGLLNQLYDVEDDEVSSILYQRGYASREEIESAVSKITQVLRKAKGESVDVGEKVDASLDDKYYLVNVPDNMLTQEQLKEKKKQIFLKTTFEGRMRAKQKKERQNQQEEEKRLENPELYLEQLRAKYKELSEKVEQRKRLKTNGMYTNGNGGVGRGERLNAAQRERMRLLTTAALDRGKGEDTFGAKEEDWQLYKLMSRDNDDDDDGHDDEEAELARVASRLQEIDPTFIAKSEASSLQVGAAPEVARSRPLTAEDFQIVLGVERFRCPEILFQPPMVGVDQTGLDETTGVSLKRLSDSEDVKERMCESILMTGGSCLLPGMGPRLEADIRKIRPYLSPLKIVRASDPVLDAWRGAAAYAASLQFAKNTFTRQDYYEKGDNMLRKYRLRYGI